MQAEVDERGPSLRVCDDGPGVPVELHGRIFDALFTTKAKGTGLGLALAPLNSGRARRAHRGRTLRPGGALRAADPERRAARASRRKGCALTAAPALLVAFSLVAAEKPSPAAPPRVSYRIDVPSRFVVNTQTTGMPSMFGHDHQLEVGDYTGDVRLVPDDPGSASLELTGRGPIRCARSRT